MRVGVWAWTRVGRYGWSDGTRGMVRQMGMMVAVGSLGMAILPVVMEVLLMMGMIIV